MTGLGKKVAVYIFLFLFLTAGTAAFAQDMDILLQKLVEKGVLTYGEAQQISTETREELRVKTAKGENDALPEWIQNTKLTGDLRIRYQHEDKTGDEDRHRGRYRFRMGVESKVNDSMKISAGLATGGDDARSTNQSMGNGGESFQSPDIRLDYAFAEWAASPWATVKAGKIKGVKSVIFQPSDLLWDSDINPEGLSVMLNNKVSDDLELFLNTGFWVLEEQKQATSDPYMVVVQPGFKYKLSDAVSLKLGVAGYLFDNVKGEALSSGADGDDSGDYNTLENGGLKYDYNCFVPGVELAFADPLGGIVPYLAFFGEYVKNPDPDEEETGYLAGIKFGDTKIKDWGQWQIKYMYRRLEKDSWIDIFGDSDAYGGHTDAKGHEVSLEYGLSKNTSFGIDYYYMERIKGQGRRTVLQFDWKLKF